MTQARGDLMVAAVLDEYHLKTTLKQELSPKEREMVKAEIRNLMLPVYKTVRTITKDIPTTYSARDLTANI